MLQMMATIETPIIAAESARLRNMSWIAANMIMPAIGENMRHQLEHLGAEGVARHRIAGDVVALRPFLLGDDGADFFGDLGAVGALFQRHINGGGLAVLRDDAVDEQRIAEQRGAQCLDLGLGLRRAGISGPTLSVPASVR